MNKLLSVSIAAYNVEEYLNETLESFVIPSVMDDIEVLIVNDGSKDKTITIAQHYVDKYPNTFKLINKENGGWGSTVNAGIHSATGKYFKLLDGDDFYNSKDLPEFMKVLQQTNADIVYTNYVTFYENDEETKLTAFPLDVIPNKKLNIEGINLTIPWAMHAVSFRTDLLKENSIKITEHCFYTDIEYLIKGLVVSNTVLFSPLEIYYYRMGRVGQSASTEGYRKHYREHLVIIKKLLQLYKENTFEKSKNTMIFNRIKGMVDAQYNIFLWLEGNKIHAQELKDFDQLIKEQYSDFYSTTRSRIKIFRFLGKWAYKYIVYK